MNNKRSYTEYTVIAPTTVFTIGFEDTNDSTKDTIIVTLNGVRVESLGYAVMRTNDQTITITPAITSGTVRLQRETDIDKSYHQFTAGALFSAKSMDENLGQIRASQQEVRDGFVFLEYNTNGIVQASKEATTQAKAATVAATASAVRAETAADTAVQAVGSLQGVVNAATTATTNANDATDSANTAASQATAATTSAQNAAQAANTAKQEAATAAANANAATVDTLAATGRANEAADVVADLVVGKVRAQDVSTSDGSTQEVKNGLKVELVENIAALRDFNPELSKSVQTCGHTNIGYGGGTFVYDELATGFADNNGTIIKSNIAAGVWRMINSSSTTVEQFGALPSNTPTLNAVAITNALSALKDNYKLNQESAILSFSNLDVTNPVDKVNINLNLKYEGVHDVSAIRLNGFKSSNLDISIDVNKHSVVGLRCEFCTGSTVPSTAVIKNIEGNAAAISKTLAGLLMVDSDDMQVFVTVDSVLAVGNKTARGVFVSDKTITKNTSTISPNVSNISNAVGDGDIFDADGVYVEHSNSNHTGGIKVINGSYLNCAKRFIKVNMPNPTITGNYGVSALERVMFAFISSYDKDAGYIAGNILRATGAFGVGYGIETSEIATSTKVVIGKNTMTSETVNNSSRAFMIKGKMENVNIEVGEVVGFASLLSHSSDVTTHNNQKLIMSNGTYDNLNTYQTFCVQLVGDFSVLNLSDFYCKNAVTGASAKFLRAGQLSDYVADITNIRQSYAIALDTDGRSLRPMNYTNPKSMSSLNTVTYRNGIAEVVRQSIPPRGSWAVGDVVKFPNPFVHYGWVCQKAETGTTDAVWVKFGAIILD